MIPMISLPRPSYHTGTSAVLGHLHGAQEGESDSETDRSKQPQAKEHDAVNDPPLVLVVDDDRDVRDSVAMVLDNEGLECLVAHNGAEALEILRHMERQPDLILLDLMMPVMNGQDFRSAQLADPRLAVIPTLILSAATHAASQARDLAATGCLYKPIDLDVLLDTAERLIPGWQPEE